MSLDNPFAPRDPRVSVDALRARVRATSAVQPTLAQAVTKILDLWETSHRVLADRSTSAPHWSGGRNSALVDVVQALADGYQLKCLCRDELVEVDASCPWHGHSPMENLRG